jgi:hypothetical protein
MAADDLVRVRVADVGGRERLAWAEGQEVTLPASVLDRLGCSGDRQRGVLVLPRSGGRVVAEDATALRLLRAFTESPPASSRLPFSYQLVPGQIRALIASAIGRWRRHQVDRWARFPMWPLDLSVDFVADLAGIDRPSFADGRTPVVLSYDLDSSEGLANLLDSFVPLEEAVGARSINFVVPCAWPVDHGRLAEIHARGHEIGVHGYDHANRTPFAAPVRCCASWRSGIATTAACRRQAVCSPRPTPAAPRRGRSRWRTSSRFRSRFRATAACASWGIRRVRSSISGSRARGESPLRAAW